MTHQLLTTSEAERSLASPCPAIVDGLKVWVVAEEEALRLTVGRVLRHCGALVREFRSGNELSWYSEGWSPDAVLLDMALNWQSVNLALQLVQALERTGGAPIARVAFFRQANFNERLAALGYGFSHRLPIPPDPKELLVVLRAAVESGRMKGIR